jgi:MATE family multidrug resistance protein
MCFAQTCIQIVIIIILREYIAIMYTNVPAVIAKVEGVLIIIAFGQFFNQMQACQQGIMRALGKKHLKAASLNCLISYYGFALPIGYLLTFHIGNDGKGLGLEGLWYGMFTGQFVLVCLYQFFITKKTDWKEASDLVFKRIAEDAEL